MSGGSFDYVFSKMQDGDLDDFARHAEAMIVEIEKVAQAIRNGERIKYNGQLRAHVTYPRDTEASIAMAAVASRLHVALGAIITARSIVCELAEVAHAVEWCASGDTGPDDVADKCIAWMEQRLSSVGIGQK